MALAMTVMRRLVLRALPTAALLALAVAPVAHAWHGTLVVSAVNSGGDPDQSFAFTAKDPTGTLLSGGSFSLKGGQQKSFTNLPAGGESGKDSWKRYLVTQTDVAGYDTAWACTITPAWDGTGKDNSLWAPAFDAGDGQHRATVELRWWSNLAYTTKCTATNTKHIPTTLTVVKRFVGAPPTAKADLRIDGQVRRAEAGDGEGTGPVEVEPGTHAFSETAPPGGELTGASDAACVDADGASVPSPAGSGPRAWTVELPLGAAVTCTITNRQTARITIVKQTDPAPAADDPFIPSFSFTSTVGYFSLAHGETHVVDVDPGAYSFTEQPRSGSLLQSITCSDQTEVVGASTVDLAQRTATVSAGPGEAVTCTFVNQLDENQKPVINSRPRSGASTASLRPAAAVRGAALHGLTEQCVDRTLVAEVRGKRVKRVMFYVDGRPVSYRHRSANGRYVLRQAIGHLAAGRHTLRARVRFTRASRLAPTSLKMGFTRCA
jgi:hypothetical protein